MNKPVFVIVTPCFNGEDYLNETILSVVSQNLIGKIFYHVQDAGSTDNTLILLEKWRIFLSDKKCPFGKAEVYFTYSSMPDSGMYDGISKGFKHIFDVNKSLVDFDPVMTWINSDDFFNPGAFQTSSNILKKHSDIRWLSGIPSHSASDGSIADVRVSQTGFLRREIYLGSYDGRKLSFIQQEGVFWRHSLWVDAGGLNDSLKLCGDWELWRRFAKYEDLVLTRSVLAIHRRHPNQKSNNLTKYWSEVDNILSLPSDGFQEELSIDLKNNLLAAIPLNSRVKQIVYDVDNKVYHKIESVSSEYLQSLVSHQDNLLIDFRSSNYPILVQSVTGLSLPEDFGSWSDKNLAPSVRIIFHAPIRGVKTLSLCLRSVDENSINTISISSAGVTKELTISNELNTHVIQFEEHVDLAWIDLYSSNFICPMELYGSGDSRKLSFGLQLIEIFK